MYSATVVHGPDAGIRSLVGPTPFLTGRGAGIGMRSIIPPLSA